MKKDEVWVVVRVDPKGKTFPDYPSVKGVYDRESAAKEAAERSRSANPDVNYLVVRSRAFLDKGSFAESSETSRKDQVQGFDPSHLPPPQLRVDLPDAISRFASELPSFQGTAKSRAPLWASLVTLAVADATRGDVNALRTEGPDILLPDGRTIEVKTVVLDPSRNRAPSVRFRSLLFDILSLVLINNDLNEAAVYFLPREAVDFYARLSNDSPQHFLDLRITPQLLSWPHGVNVFEPGPPS